jgi:hypothetical protein
MIGEAISYCVGAMLVIREYVLMLSAADDRSGDEAMFGSAIGY